MAKPYTVHNVWKKHDNAIDQLNDLFGVGPVNYSFITELFTGRLTPFRRKPGVPNMRPDAAANARRKKRKAARLARRRNRG